MKKSCIPFLIFYLLITLSFAQEDNFKSIHQEESEYYSSFNLNALREFDSISEFYYYGFQKTKDYQLNKKVFGYFPYWAGSNYLNYQWDLLSDLCYFSYEVDPYTGNPVTIHDWETSPAIDSAFANDVKVHLCVTIFSGHSSFFGNEDAQQTLISNIITLLQDRGAHGVNMDVELLPSSLGDEFTDFMNELDDQIGDYLPEAEISIASPAVNWSGTFNLLALKNCVDFFMIMGYDYYWNGSSQAGPVSPLYSMTGNFDYNFSKTITYYQSQGVPNEQLVLGVPYYARQWPTVGQYAPSATTGNGTAYTYRYIRNNSSTIYTNENKLWESNSFAPYYAFENNGWYQCFVDDVYSMGKKYDQVVRRNLAGIGIWALGYDDGYTELWELIADKYTSESISVTSDTIFDTGGPSFDYYNNENYSYTISVAETSNLYLSFSYLNLEEGYDSLFIFDGPDTSSPVIGGFSGDSVPGLIVSSTNSITLQFNSDNGITDAGWRAVFDTIPISFVEDIWIDDQVWIYPNPTNHKVLISPPFFSSLEGGYRGVTVQILNSSGSETYSTFIKEPTTVNVNYWRPGIYLVNCINEEGFFISQKLIVN